MRMGPFTRLKSKNCKETAKYNSESNRENIKNDKRNLKLTRPKLIDKSVDNVTNLVLNDSFVVLEYLDSSLLNDCLSNGRVALRDKTNTVSNYSKNMPNASVDGSKIKNSNFSQKGVVMDSSTLERRATRQSPRISESRTVQKNSSIAFSNVKDNSKLKNGSSSQKAGIPSVKQCDQIFNTSNQELDIDSTIPARSKVATPTGVSATKRNHCAIESSPSGYDGHPDNCNVNILSSTPSGRSLRNKNRELARESPFIMKRRQMSVTSEEATFSTNLKSAEKELILSGNNSERNKLSDNTCVYSKVTRDTLNNKNMPPEEKIALYDFEVDENEPVVNKKKKRKVYVKRARKPVLRNKKHCDVSKNPPRKLKTIATFATRTMNEESANNFACAKEQQSSLLGNKLEPQAEECSHKEKENSVLKESTEQCKKVTESVKDIHSEKHVHFESIMQTEDNSLKSDVLGVDTAEEVGDLPVPLSVRDHEQLPPASPMPLTESHASNMKTPKSANPKSVGRVRMRYRKQDQENVSPIARPSCRRTPARKLHVLDQENSSKREGYTKENSKISDIPSSPHLFQQDVISGGILESPDNAEDSRPVNECHISTVSDSIPKGLGHSTPVKDHPQNTTVNLDKERDLISPIPVTHSSHFSPYKGPRRGSSVNSPLNRIASNQSVPLIRKVFLLPRVSGGGKTTFEQETLKKWDVDNCFGFEDECEERELNSAVIESVDKSANVRAFVTTPRVLSPKSTPANNERKLDSVSENKLCKSPTFQVTKKNKISTPCPAFSNPIAAPSPFSNLLKQSKLDFSSVTPKTTRPKDESLGTTVSPVLFKDDDKTPTHFSEPPRRSYNRHYRKNLQYVGDEWIEVDEDEHEEEKTKSKKPKQHKRNKQEEKEAQKWIKNFKNQCEEVEEFELCVE